jgi:hypothetical protein
MTWKRVLILVLVLAVSVITSGFTQPPSVQAEPQIFASPVHAGCYLEKIDRCKIHVEPFTINLETGEKLVRFTLLATRASSGTQTMIYDFRPDQSNPVPPSGDTYTPSLVAKDFAAYCGETYTVNLEGQDTGDANPYNLGTTGQFTCPAGTYRLNLPVIYKN